jgi:hypothetical protein
MSISCIPRADLAGAWTPPEERLFPQQFWLGIAIAGLIWAALVAGTMISAGSSPTIELLRLSLTQ